MPPWHILSLKIYHHPGCFYILMAQTIQTITKVLAGILSMTIATVEQSQLKNLDKEHLKKADFILVIDKQMTKTY